MHYICQHSQKDVRFGMRTRVENFNKEKYNKPKIILNSAADNEGEIIQY